MVERQQPVDLPQVVVADSKRALGALARDWRARFAIPLVAVTGTNGKTTTKEMTAAILRARYGLAEGYDSPVLATYGNLNNEIGTPVTLLWLRDWHRAAVIEMGASARGSIGYLASLALPDVGIISNAGPAHLEGFGASVRDVAEAKGELFTGLKEGGVAVINRDDAFFDYWRELCAGRRVVSFGLDPSADFRAADVRVGAELDFRMETPVGGTDVHLPMAGRHNVRNALAAAAAALAAVPSCVTCASLAAMRNVPGRLCAVAGPRGSTLYDDTYNANPGSVKAAIEFLADLDGERWLVLGDMRELGADERALHREVGGLAIRHKLDRLYGVGELARRRWTVSVPARNGSPTSRRSPRAISADLAAGVGARESSRGMGMERLVQALGSRCGHGRRRHGRYRLMFPWLAESSTQYVTAFNAFTYLTLRAIMVRSPRSRSRCCSGHADPPPHAAPDRPDGADDGPQSHLQKAGTPTMGGTLILLAILASTLAPGRTSAASTCGWWSA